MRLLVFVVVVLAVLVARAPATLFDRLAGDVSGGGVRIGQAEGTIWSGHGVVDVLEATTRSRRPWYRLQWSFDPIGLFRGRLAWKIIVGDAEVSMLSFGMAGWQVTNLRIGGPARYFLQRIPGPLSKLGWDGDVRLEASRFECSWRGLCSGGVDATWRGAGSDFLPGQVFGDYKVEVNGTAGEFSLDWSSSEESAVRTSGRGRVSPAGAVSLAGTVKGDPLLLSRLPAIAGPWAKPTDAGDTWKIVFP
jgi:hypothetical protein